MNKEIEKYVGLYLLVYVAVLAVCGFFQYMAVCQGKSLACTFDMQGINTIITTTAYVITPIVAIIGFLSWKDQHNRQVISKDAKAIWNILNIETKLIVDINTKIQDSSHSSTVIDPQNPTRFVRSCLQFISKLDANGSEKFNFLLLAESPKTSILLTNYMEATNKFIDIVNLAFEEGSTHEQIKRQVLDSIAKVSIAHFELKIDLKKYIFIK